MQRPNTISGVRGALAIAVLLSLPLSMTELRKTLHSGAGDFNVYLNAAYLVREHESNHIYDGADTGQDPQLQPAVPGSRFAQMAVDHGLSYMGLYVYPPALADALVPLTYLSLRDARLAWQALDVLAMIGTGLLLAWMIDIPCLSLGGLGIVAAVLLFRTDISAVYWGQVTLVLLLLWTAGIVLYDKGMTRASAMVMALAVVIKLTPLLILVPMLFWKQWSWVRWFLGSLAACCLLIVWINGPATLADYFLHVLPPMSAGIPGIMNASLAGGMQLLWAALRGVDVNHTYYIHVSTQTVMDAKLASLALLAAACVGLYRNGLPASHWDRIKTLALVALLSVCVAPVSWRHAYTLALPILFVLWHEAFQRPPSRAWLAALIFFTLAFGFVVDSLIAKVAHGVAFGAVALIVPITSLVIVFVELARIHRARGNTTVAG